MSLYAKRLTSFSMEQMEYNTEQRLIMTSIRAAELVTAEELEQFQTVEDMALPAYAELRNKLRSFAEQANILYVYYVRPVGTNVQYIIDNDFNEATRVGLDTKPHPISSVPNLYGALDGRTVVTGLGNYTPGWEGLLTSYSPIFDKNGKITALVGVDIRDMPIVRARNAMSFLTSAQIFAIILIFIALIFFLIRLRFQAESIKTVRETNRKLFTNIPIKKRFLIFSIIFFIVIIIAAGLTFFFTIRQLGYTKIEHSLNLAIENQKLRMANEVNSDLGLLIKLADDSIIQNFFLQPGSTYWQKMAFDSLASYRKNFKNNSIFFISDVDKMFIFNDAPPYYVDPHKPENYWYNLTLYDTVRYNFNINYNPDLNMTNLWVNAPVFRDNKPIGLLGTSINLTQFIISLNSTLPKNIDVYYFNRFNEITISKDPLLALNKTNIRNIFGSAEDELLNILTPNDGEKISIITHDNEKYAISYIPLLDWFIVAHMSVTAANIFDPTITTIFIVILALVFTIFYVSYQYIGVIQTTVDHQNNALLELKDEAEEANRTKSNFLASMSHEIRTPMNAICGMSELLLTHNLDDKSKDYANDIKQASSNLLSIINDLLDFSKIEAGHLELSYLPYDLSSLLYDVVNIIRIRTNEKQIRFFTNIDPSIPNLIIGDELRLRQILLNLLNNSVKYTQKGFIGLTMTKLDIEPDMVTIKIDISDSGIGIKYDDQQRLFNQFVQVNVTRNRGIEGTGLGLAITKNLCEAMGGHISVKSQYHHGSVFTAIVSQKIDKYAPFAVLEDLNNKNCLIFDRRKSYLDSLAWSLEKLNVPFTSVSTFDEFSKQLSENHWNYIFSGYGLYGSIKGAIIQNQNTDNPKLNLKLVLMTEWGNQLFNPDLSYIALPVNSMSIANLLNGIADQTISKKQSKLTSINFSIPDANILVVDDLTTNLKVIEGILAKYQPHIDTALSGQEAIEMVKNNQYDAIFMDHMMPGMDGVEATKLIRDVLSQGTNEPRNVDLPIIALTANAISGMREFFLANGFNDFLAKPIDIFQLNELLIKWIPLEKQLDIDDVDQSTIIEPIPDVKDMFKIPGIDINLGLAITGGSFDNYKQILMIFSKDAKARLAFIENIPTPETISIFTTQVHALKSASASIGATKFSENAKHLEARGRDGDLLTIKETLPDFYNSLTSLIDAIDSALSLNKDQDESFTSDGESAAANASVLMPLLSQLVDALNNEQAGTIDSLLKEIDSNIHDAKTKDIYNNIYEQVLLSEFAEAINIVDSLIAQLKTDAPADEAPAAD
jgi:signal transduction histidine kinase/CheY-like chemotaxis protein